MVTHFQPPPLPATRQDTQEGSKLLARAFEQDPENPYTLVLLSHFSLQQGLPEAVSRMCLFCSSTCLDWFYGLLGLVSCCFSTSPLPIWGGKGGEKGGGGYIWDHPGLRRV